MPSSPPTPPAGHGGPGVTAEGRLEASPEQGTHRAHTKRGGGTRPMNRWKLVLALGAALTMPAVAGSWALGHGTQGRAGEAAQSERELLRLEHEWNTAYQK